MRHPSLALLGAAAIAEAILFNAAFSLLAARFDYPDVLRQPAAQVLAAFRDGGAALILTWYAFALSALALAPLAIGLGLAGRAPTAPRIGAAILGALAGTVQAIGLIRWTVAVPMLATLPDAQAQAFLVLNQWGGVGIGEQLGYAFTALFAAAMAQADWTDGRRALSMSGVAAALLVAAGMGEGVAQALGRDGTLFATVNVAGYVVFSGWLVAQGALRLREAWA